MDLMRRLGRMSVALAVSASTTVVAVSAPPAVAAPAQPAAPSTCDLGNGVSHVVQITFDNVHFFRDNPNVPSDLELMPHLLNFIEHNGTMLSNNHTPLIAHTADDLLTNYTGLYGDRHGMPVSNSYQAYNADGTTDPAGSFAYWTDPVFDTAKTPNLGHDTNPSMVYSATPPATTTPAPARDRITPAPWVPFTRAGCNVGDVSTANMVLENTKVDIPKVFGPTSPENAQLQADKDTFKDAETADYVGLAVHCAKGATFCAGAKGVKFGQTTPTPTATPDVLPTEPGGYHDFSGVFGHRYMAPQLGAGSPNVSHNGFPVTNSAGNLVDLAGNQINGAFLNNQPGFPGFGDISAAQSLAYVADLQETGVPVTYGYISDLHGNHFLPNTTACDSAPDALGPGDPCYIAQAQAFDAAFATFFKRLAADGITANNSLFVFTADEGDHVAGANVGRAVQPTPATCDGVKVVCTYPAGTFGELNTNVTGLLATQKNNTTGFTLEQDSAPQFYVTGRPGPSAEKVRTLERDVAGLTASNPYSGNANEKLTNYLADRTEEAILHIVNADPARTPTFTMFAKPDYFLHPGTANCSTPCVSINNGFAYNHGDYAPEINTSWLGLVGPGVAHNGVDGLGPKRGPSSAGPNSGQGTIPGSGTTGTWADHTDIRPTTLYLVGLKDDYTGDGRVLTEDLTNVGRALRPAWVEELAETYKQLNASVGRFGTSTLIAATNGIESASPGDGTYTLTMALLSRLEVARDSLANIIKDELNDAAFNKEPIDPLTALVQTGESNALQSLADMLAGGHSAAVAARL
jgi:hypothetical protein